MEFFEFILLAFVQFPEPLGLCILPNLGTFEPLFLSIHVQSHSLFSGTLMTQMSGKGTCPFVDNIAH